MTQPVPLFTGEAMLLSWGDTSSRGKTVTFALHEDDCGESHPFRDLGTGKHGQRFQIVAVPITDEGEPVSPGASGREASHGSDASLVTPTPAKTGGASGESKGGWYGLKPSARAALLCKESDFAGWVGETTNIVIHSEEQLTDWLRRVVGVHSRAHLDDGHPQFDARALKKYLEIERSYRISRGLETAEVGR